MEPGSRQGAGGGLCVRVYPEQTECCVAAVNEMGGYQGKQASLSPA